MKKNELVHVHALLACVAEDFLERGIADSEAFDDYRALGTSSMALRASRDDHEAAVRRLADTLATAAERAERPNSDADGGEYPVRSQ